jgi:hypothetical protein
VADEATTTDVTNSAEATQTDASAVTDSSSSTTTQTDAAGEADGLDGASLLGDAEGAKPGDADGGDDQGEGGDADASGGDNAGGEGGSGEGDGADDDKGEPALTGAPEGAYDLAKFLPEGMAVDQVALDKISDTAKALNLSDAGLAKIATEALPIVTKQVSDGIINEVVSQRAAWDAETRIAIQGGKDAEGNAIKADPIFGGKGFDDVLATSAKALDRFGGAEFRDFLKSTGLGNHPSMVRFAYQAGSLISEDTDFERGGGIPNTPKSREEKYYGS